MQLQLDPKPFWHPLWAGLALGLVLLLTFLITGHGLGATGFTTRLTAWLASGIPTFVGEDSYLGPLAEDGIFSAWITWQVIGVAVGAVLSAKIARRIRVQIDGEKTLGVPRRLLAAFAGGMLAGLGARIAAGCTSGMGLSGAATLSLAGFTFLVTFFAAGLIMSRIFRGVQ
ncbi:MAG: transporter [Burkholderiaceae bacterium]|nr:transporter [Burkholderiaceae bacterium]